MPKFKATPFRRLLTGVGLAAGAVYMAVLLQQDTTMLEHMAIRAAVIPKTATSVILEPDKPIAAAPAPVPPSPVAKPTVKKSTRPTVAKRPAKVVAAAPGSSVTGLTPTTPSSSGGAATTSGYTSTNWSGYLMTGTSFTAVSGSWTATSPTGVAGTVSADSAWIGIGGVSASDLIQVGTENTVSTSGQVQTAAFYEMLPDASIPISTMTVAAGDAISAAVTQTAPGQWSISLTDETTGQTFNQAVSYASSLSSAEWIEEDPSFSSGRQIPFDNFGTIPFTGAHAIGNGSGLNLTSGNAQPVTMVNHSGQIVAAPSAVGGDGASFRVSP